MKWQIYSTKKVRIGILLSVLLFLQGVQYWSAHYLGNRDGQIDLPLFLIGLSILNGLVYTFLILTLLSSRIFKSGRSPIPFSSDRLSAHVLLPLDIGILCSVVTGCLELIILLLLSDPATFASFQDILPPLASATGFFFVLYTSSWFLISYPIQRLFHLQCVPLALALASFWMMLFTYTSLNRFVDIFNSLPELYKLYFMGICFAIASISIYFVLKQIDRKYFYHLMPLGVLAPLIASEVLLWIWIKTSFEIPPVLNMIIPVLYAGLLVFSIEFFLWMRSRVSMLILLRLVFSFILFSPFITSKIGKSPSLPFSDFSERSHDIQHVILIIVDTLRPDFLSCYGSQKVQTPHIDQLANDGVLFENTFSVSSWTVPAVSSIMTGLPPEVHGMKTTSSRLPDRLPTLAEYMYEEGYYTSAIGRNSYLTPQFNISQGFLEYLFFPSPQNRHVRGINFFQWLFPERFRTDVSTENITALATDWLSSHHKEDFFLWLHYFDPHMPYAPPESTLPREGIAPSIGKDFSEFQDVRGGYLVPTLQERESIKELYAAEVRHIDNNIGKLMTTLKALNIYEDSLIIFSSDHGEEFWEHNSIEHGHTLYNEVLRVPLIIKPPSGFGFSSWRVEQSVSLRSILPTILDLCKISAPVEQYAPSLSPFSKFINGSYVSPPIMSSSLLYYEDRESVIFGGMKYIRSLLTNYEELYDLTKDPDEHTSLVSEFPDRVLRAQNLIHRHKNIAQKLKEHYALIEAETIDIDDETVQQLKSLGYVR